MIDALNKDLLALKDAWVVFRKLVSPKQIENEYAIVVENLNQKEKKKVILNGVTFSVKTGTIHALVGPSGSGKSAVVKNVVDTYYSHDKHSKIYIDGISSHDAAAKARIAYMPDYVTFPDHLTLGDYLETMGRLSGLSKDAAERSANELLELMQLQQQKFTHPSHLPVGLRKKIVLAQALLSDPHVIVLDDPAEGIDPQAVPLLFNVLRELTTMGITVLFTTRDVSSVEQWIDTVTVLNQGTVAYTGDIATLKKVMDDDVKTLRIYTAQMDEVIKLAEKSKNVKFKQEEDHLLVSALSNDDLNNLMAKIQKAKIVVDKAEFDSVTMQQALAKEGR